MQIEYIFFGYKSQYHIWFMKKSGGAWGAQHGGKEGTGGLEFTKRLSYARWIFCLWEDPPTEDMHGN